MSYLLVGLAAALLLLFGARAFVAADPARLARGLQIGAMVVIGVLVPIVLLTEGVPVALFLLPLPALLGARRLWRRRGGADAPQGGANSSVETAYLRMSLDHDSGTMSGVVRRGRFAGARLAELARDELLDLRRECRAEDAESVPLVESWLDRAYPDWRSADRPEAPRSGAMTRDEAYAVLGLKSDARADEIKAAHRRLIQKVHPDHGGSDWLAARLNQAKELLLGN